MAPLGFQLVENHLTSLRRLAQRLVANPDDAEDAVQETWLMALRSPPSSRHRLRGWLETVLRNVVRRRHRQERRSNAREQHAARPVSVQPTVDVVVRQQQLDALTGAIRELPLELQEVVFLRYFEDLPPRRIAERTGRPVARVYRSLERAKIRLRRALQERDASWRKGIGMLVGLRPAATTLAVGGWIVLSKKLMAVLGLSLALFLSYLLSSGAGIWTDATVAPEPSDIGLASPPGGLPGEAEETVREVPERREVAPERSGLREMAPYEFDLEIHARTEEDLPAPGITILLAPELHPLNEAKTDDAGVLRVRFRGRVPSMAMVIACLFDLSSGRRLRRIQVASGETARAAIRVRTSFGLPWGSPSRRTPKLIRDPQGFSWFTAGHVLTDEATVDVASPTTVSAKVPTVVQVEGGKARERVPVRERVLNGIVRDARGRPAINALVLVGDRTRTMTGPAGRFALRFRARDGDRVSVRAGGGDHGLAQLSLEIGSLVNVTCNPELDRGIEFRGRLVDAKGGSLAGWRIEIEPDDGTPWIDGAKTDDWGAFAIPNVAARPYRVRAFAPGRVLQSFSTAGLHPSGVHVLSAVAPATPGTFQVAAHSMDGATVPRLDVRLWDDALGEGRIVLVWKPKRVLPGSYEMVVAAAGFAPRHGIRVRVDSGKVSDMGDIDLGQRAVLEAGGGEEGSRLFHLHPAVPSWINIDKRAQVAVPPGTYRVMRGSSELEFEITPGLNRVPAK